MATHIDVLIVGGGPAGVAAAILLHRRGVRVALIDATAPGTFKVGEGLIPVARRILDELSIGSSWLDADHLPSMGNRSAWGGDTLAATDYIRSLDGHGWHLDRAAFDATLRAQAAAAGVPLHAARLQRVSRTEAGWSVQLSAGGSLQTMACQWLIDATGRPHTVARALGIKRDHRDALLGHWLCFEAQLPGDSDTTGLVEAVQDGWWYSARLPSGQRIVQYFTDTGDPTAVQALDLQGYLQLIIGTQHIADLLARFHYLPSGRPKAVDARSGRLPRTAGPGWIATGDAAMAFDPLSSQGIYTALYGGIQAGKALAATLQGDANAIPHYEASLDAVWTAYLEHWQQTYAGEQRWRGSEFWQRRQG